MSALELLFIAAFGRLMTLVGRFEARVPGPAGSAPL
jgi:hypothetical protein